MSTHDHQPEGKVKQGLSLEELEEVKEIRSTWNAALTTARTHWGDCWKSRDHRDCLIGKLMLTIEGRDRAMEAQRHINALLLQRLKKYEAEEAAGRG